MKTIQFGLLIILIFAMSCKNSNTTPAEAKVTKNNSTLFDNTGLTDISSILGVKPYQEMAEAASYIHFKSGNIVTVYLNARQEDKTNYAQMDVISVLGKKIDYGVDFVVDSLDLKSSPVKINLKTVKNDKVKNGYRPNFVFSIPKKYTTSSPVIILDTEKLAGMAIE